MASQPPPLIESMEQLVRLMETKTTQYRHVSRAQRGLTRCALGQSIENISRLTACAQDSTGPCQDADCAAKVERLKALAEEHRTAVEAALREEETKNDQQLASFADALTQAKAALEAFRAEIGSGQRRADFGDRLTVFVAALVENISVLDRLLNGSLSQTA